MAEIPTRRVSSSQLARIGLVLGIAGPILFVVIGTMSDSWGFLAGVADGIIAFAVSLRARQQDPERTHRRMTTAGLVLGAIPVVWFVAYFIVIGIAALF
jgi:hypothetical protein